MRTFQVIAFTSLSVLLAMTACRKDPKIDELEDPNDTLPGPPAPVYCQSETIYTDLLDTVFSDSYLAAYPGSWWTYSDGETVTCVWANYNLISGETIEQPVNNYCTTYYFDSVCVPRLIGCISTAYYNPYVFENCFLRNVDYYPFIYQTNYHYSKTLFEKQILSSSPNWISYSCLYQPGLGYCDNIGRERIELLDSIILPNNLVFYDVIHVKQIAEFVEDPGTAISYGDLYYANEVGLIWQIEESTLF